MQLYILVVGPILIATLGYFLPRTLFRVVLLTFQVAQTALAGYLLVIVRSEGVILQQVGGWAPVIGIALRADLLGTTMVFFTTLLYLFLFLFSVRKKYTDNMFQFLYIVIQGVTISVFLSQDIFNIYVLIEVMTIMISVLIMWKRDKQALYDGTLYLLINLFAMSFFLLGIGLLYRTLGVLNFQAMEARVAQVTDPRSLILPLSFMLTAVSLKAALMPLFSWLPHAHGTPSAPSIVSAVLSGLLVKVGIYLFIRLRDIFSAAMILDEFFLVIGAGTAVIGILLALTQRDIKLILAYSTVSQIGLIMVGLNSGITEAYWGSIFHILNHGLFKALLFLTAGAIAKEYGTKDINKIRGAIRRVPMVSIAAILAISGIIGTPFFNGAISKYLIQSGFTGVNETIIYIINFGTTLVFIKYAVMFWGNSGASRTSQPDPFVNSVTMAMGIACIVLGIAARPVIGYLFEVNVSVEGAYYADKFVAWALTVGAAIPVYYFGVRKASFFATIRQTRLSFPDMALLVTVFLASLMAWLYYTV
ncbi:MAG: proton-conducting membrane transporter [Spirochaetaceae bacterium]|nr:MAG: proton-conducting membrane transporter [Spirochaetaceae bacterium]